MVAKPPGQQDPVTWVRDCPVCSGVPLETFLVRRHAPVHQNLLCPTLAAARNVPRGDLAFAVCAACGFVLNRAFDPAKLSYGGAYENTQSCSPGFRRHMARRVNHLVRRRGVRHKRIVEIGCGKGGFLRSLVAGAETGNTGVGFDPSYVGPTRTCGGRLVFHKRLYAATALRRPGDVAVSRHVIEHVADPVRFLAEIRRALVPGPQARVFLETPCVEWILSNHMIWDFFYEHCSLFSPASLRFACRAAGFRPVHVARVFGGQYLWAEAAPAGTPSRQGRRQVDRLLSLASKYQHAEERMLGRWHANLRRWASRGPVAIWGAGAKGVTLANLIDPDARWIEALIDINPAKQGHFVPGTGHPIVGIGQIGPRRIGRAILTNPNYRPEIHKAVRRAGLAVELVE